ncbi:MULTISPECIES: DUF5681 domain-containing protein [unclassified Methylobacterium]|uniref:DUF5681 domain-containing protein n=1 Tax=unclassified Methylobacterium TaxID=2615210 RepID=UPI0011C1F7DA|nr:MULTISPECIES: DUF5681 domain-containing protein [unclassified Methylobacterium]QEE37609.1 hypothetical protein FVA80_00205 [Methylobacterium sp. WL1]TXN52338.1 hypothetical protein FV241_29665 [Methylobacterium sp. WL2]
MPSEETQFGAGRSGNPAGRPKGARNRATQAVEALLDGEAEALTRKAIEMALSGDGPAMRLCLDRLCPPRKDKTITFTLPEIETAADLTKATKALLHGVADGEITPSEAAELSKLVDAHTKAIEAVDLATRLSALEHAAGGKR